MDHDPTQPHRPRKWRNEPVAEDGHIFDSKAERDRYRLLKARLLAHEIIGLVVHPKFTLAVNGQVVGVYIADFGYRETATDLLVVEDVKSPVSRTPIYRLKKRLMRALFGIDIREL